jgi:cytoskeletal protein CcmA (bactofilin family)
LARDIKEGTLSGFVGGGTVVTGEANFKAMMRVDGHLSGRVSSASGTLIVGSNGKVDANIEVAVAQIHGTVNGDIIASQRLELGRSAKVNGNIQTPSLVIEQGAVFEGSCKMLQMSAAVDKNRKDKKSEPLDTSRIQPINADGAKSTEIPSVSNVVS